MNTKRIAELAGVSRSTVQRALSNHPHIAEATKRQVLSIAGSVGYRPNRTARALVMRQQKLKYGVIFASSANPFFQEELKGIHRACEELNDSGVTIDVVFMERIDPDEQVRLIDRLVQEQARGIVLVAIDTEEVRQAVNRGIQAGTRFLTITSDIEGTGRLCYVGQDHRRGGRVAGGLMRWLVPPGAEVACILGSQRYLSHRERLAGFLERYPWPDGGSEGPPVLENQDDSELSARLTEDLFRRRPGVRGLFVVGAGVEGTCEALARIGLGGKVRVICFDRIPSHMLYCLDGLIDVVIDQEPFQQGYRALELLNNFIMFGDVPADRVLSRIEIYTRENIERGE